MIIAIDGPAASGKGTLGRRLAEYFDCAHLDTGKLYRMVATNVLRSGGNPANPSDALAAARALDPSRLDAPELDSDETARAASLVAAIPEVRDVLRGLQQAFAKMPPDGAVGAVLDGRDIGTVICPDADIKFFVTATVEARAERRHKELKNLGKDSIYARVLQDLKHAILVILAFPARQGSARVVSRICRRMGSRAGDDPDQRKRSGAQTWRKRGSHPRCAG